MTADRLTTVLIRFACLVYLSQAFLDSSIVTGFMKGLTQ